MATQLIDRDWGNALKEAVAEDPSGLRIICPFIKLGALQPLLRSRPTNIQVITRFNLDDFADGVSDIAALRRLLDVGAEVRGVKNLHAKLYIVGRNRAIITSANLTEAALIRNQELGVVAERGAILRDCLRYFDDLWGQAGNNLPSAQLDEWERSVEWHRLAGGWLMQGNSLGDNGVDICLPPPQPRSVPLAVAEASQSFVKFAGNGGDRLPLSSATIDEVRIGGVHRAAWYPTAKRPRKVKDGDIIYISRMTRDPNDMRVFGRAIGMAYVEGRDDASASEIELRPWKETWSRCIRLHHAEFLDGTLADGVSLNKLMDTLGAEAFASTQQNAANGTGNTNPRHALRQQAAVRLSPEGYVWLNERLQEAFEVHGTIPRETLNQLDWPDPVPSS